jgi:hypothetical protein
VFRAHVWDRWIRKDAAVEVRHDVEGCANDTVIFAEDVGAWNGDIGGGEGRNDSVLAVDSVSGFAE